MKATKITVAAFYRAAIVLLLFALQSCSTYNTKTADIENQLVTGRFKEASQTIDANKFLNKKRNRLLYLLEKGKMEHLDCNYSASNKLLEEAYILIDDQIKSNAGQTVAAKFTNPMAEPYKGEDFEKVTIHYYMALNYFFLGQPDEALVEAKRINIKLLQLNDKYKDNKNKYARDAFSQILQGILYEATGDVNNAFIAYRNTEEIYSGSDGVYFDVPMPEQLKKDLIRTSRQLGFTDEYNSYLRKFNITPKNATVPPSGEAIVFWENGLAPAKDQIIITASGGGHFFYGTYMDDNIQQDILIPIPFGTNIGSINAIAIPKYRRRESYYTKAALIVNGKEQLFEEAQDFNSIAKQCLKDRMLRETIDIVVRFAAKKGSSALLAAIAKETMGDTGEQLVKLGADAAGALTEKADTRNWQSLPATISYIRVPLQEGVENKFVIKKYGSQGIDTDTVTVPYKRGLQIVNYFDLGRTQITPSTTVKATLPTVVKALPIDKTVAQKYDTWKDAGNGLSYKVSYYLINKDGAEQYGKKINFASDKEITVTYTITDKPVTKDMKLVTLDEFEKLEDEGKTNKVYYTLTDKVKPGKEITGWYPFIQKNPDFYVTVLKVE
jgi:hypothetical protein